MDVDDDLSEPRSWRRRACGCLSLPARNPRGCGCLCPLCGALCQQCVGYGYAVPPRKRVHQILTRVRSQIRRRCRQVGIPPGFVRLNAGEIGALLRKRAGEGNDHWILDYVDPGPPVRVFGVLIVLDVRRTNPISGEKD